MSWQKVEVGAFSEVPTCVAGVRRPIHKYNGADTICAFDKLESRARDHEGSFIQGLDVHKESIVAATTLPGDSKTQLYGTFGGTLDKLIKKLENPNRDPRFVYEVGANGAAIQRMIQRAFIGSGFTAMRRRSTVQW